MGAAVAIVCRFERNLVLSASLVLVIFSIVVAGAKEIPRSNAIHWLSASILCALLKLMGEWTAMTAILGSYTDLVRPALSVLVIRSIVVTGAVSIPGAHTVHWLTAATLSALLEVVLEWTLVAIVVGLHTHRVSSAALILVLIILKQRHSVLKLIQLIKGVEAIIRVNIQVILLWKLLLLVKNLFKLILVDTIDTIDEV